METFPLTLKSPQDLAQNFKKKNKKKKKMIQKKGVLSFYTVKDGVEPFK